MHPNKYQNTAKQPHSRLVQRIATLTLFWVVGCVDSGGELGEAPHESIGQAQQFVVWSPASALITEHGAWHNTSTCVNTTSTTKIQPLAARPPCQNRPGRGEAFLMWHRNFLQRLRDSYATNPGAGTPDDALTWTELPAAMKLSANGWTSSLQVAEDNILRLRTAAQAQPTLDEFGMYVESFYHNALHTIASTAYPSDAVVGNVTNSPSSTYFFKIHGLIDWHLERFMRANFSGTTNSTGVISTTFPPDGRADLLVSIDNGSTEIHLQQELTTNVITTRTSTVLPAGPATPAGQTCNWYVGAVTDLNTDGWNDLVWHGPGCNLTKVWYMRGSTRIAGAAGEGDLTNPQAGMNDTWFLLGAADFNYDRHPDLVWTHGPQAVAPNPGSDTWNVEIWQMKRAARVDTVTVPLAIGTDNSFHLLLDYGDNGYPDFLSGNFWLANNYVVQPMKRRNAANGPMLGLPAVDGAPINLGFNLPDTRVQSFGRFSLANREPDFAFASYLRTGTYHSFGLRGPSNSWLTTELQSTASGHGAVVGPH